MRGEGLVLLKIPRGDINGVGEDEVTVTSGLQMMMQIKPSREERRVQKEQTNRGERATS